MSFFLFFFFFQAEDGIRDGTVTGVQTCALPISIGNRQDPVRLVFTADPGPGIVVALTDMRDRFRLTANAVELVFPDEPLPRLPVGRAVWRPAPDFATSAACWLAAGAAHHTCLSTAVGADAFR